MLNAIFYPSPVAERRQTANLSSLSDGGEYEKRVFATFLAAPCFQANKRKFGTQGCPGPILAKAKPP